MAEQGAGADVVSGGELALALKAGFPAERIVYASVGKTDKEIEFAIKNDILALNVESCQELQVVNQIAESMNKKASVSIRINPDVDIEGHPYITTGTSANKFGIQLGEAESCMEWASKQPHINLVGIHCHIGSLIDKLDAYIKSAEILVDFVLKLRKTGRNNVKPY